MIGIRQEKTQTPTAHFNRFYHPQREKHIVKVTPGGVYCTQRSDELIATGLGSCIAACVWDETANVGGMNHFLLPFDNYSQIKSWQPESLVSTASRYGIHAMEMLLNALIERGAERDNLQFKLFGGAQMLGRHSMIGAKNVAFILKYVEQEQLKVIAQDLGGLEPRKVMFDPISGKAWLKRIPFTEVHRLQHQEEKYAHQLDRESHRKHDDDVELF
ncbi:chemotaxis protein CheD [Vibrio sinaloensis]|uniref:chemotaxis protein CheD n=1 Tax=Photobacterium sp. (strain ATCC 43367) TaxID=379097 RepID=UPI00057D17FF|nr:chemotaxis protein CheD [Vibrio sinaloensis]KHT50447.1 chemotaxis protein CheD [Vibrio sinaloensis]